MTDDTELDDILDQLMIDVKVEAGYGNYRLEARRKLEAWSERREAAARIDELKHLDSLTYSFMSLGHDFDYSYRQSAIDDRIKQLTSDRTGGGEGEA